MYCLYKQLHVPTGVEHCVYCNFFNYSERNLVIAAVNTLHVYRVTPEFEEEQTEGEISEEKAKQKLECLTTFSLFGNIMSLQHVKLPGAQRDALLLSFSDAKLSVVEYDPGTHDLQTTSLHYFEETTSKHIEIKDGFTMNHYIPEIRVDPDGRCAAMLIYGTRLVILPFRREVLIEDAENVTQNKSPIMSSYIIDLLKFDEKIVNVIDFQFLNGYYEPTVFILYEPLQTWAGRIAVRADSCSIVAISLNIQERVHPIIWSLSNLPFDCCKVMAVPRPIGGVLVFAVNSLLYLNQSVPPYGVALNSIANNSTMFPLRTQENVRITLDCAQAAFMSYDRLVLSLKGGELYVLTLVVDGMRSVRSFHFDKSAASVLTTCTCICDDNFLFLGSRLGNSLLLKYTEKASDTIFVKPDEKKKTDEPPTKKKKMDGTTDMASDISAIENLDELEVYGTAENPSGTTISSYAFEVYDNIWNIAPCGQAIMGEPAFLSEEFSNPPDPDLELVVTSGFAKNGALSVLQRNIRPQVVTTFELPGCIDMWTVKGQITDQEGKSDAAGKAKKRGSTEEGEEKTNEDEDEEEEEDISDGHTFLILTRNDSSMILQTGQEIMELDHSGFSTQTATIFAGNIGQDKYIVQVSPSGVRLLEGVNQLQHIPIDVGSPINACSVADPYMLLLSMNGQVLMYTLKEDSHGPRLVMSRPSITQHSKVLVACVYRDVSGLFITKMDKTDEVVPEVPVIRTSTTEKVFSFDSVNVDDEDELLYGGDADTSVFSATMDTSMKSEPDVQTNTETKKKKVIKPSYWLFVCRENGALEVYSMTDYKLSYYIKNFSMGFRVLVDSVQMTEKLSTSGSTTSFNERGEKVSDIPVVKELIMVALGYRKTRPYLMCRVDEEFYIYEVFPYHQLNVENHLKIRFKKIQHGIIMREKKMGKSKRKTDAELDLERLEETIHSSKLRYFENIAGYSGVFVCGPFPHWIFMTSRGCLRVHPMAIDGKVTSFSPFHNVNCPNGFLYFNAKGDLRISVLPTHLTYDAPWPVRKVPLRCTPHFVVYHPDKKIYSVVTSTTEICTFLPKNTEEREWDIVEKDERYVYPPLKTFNVQLYSPSSWEVVPNTNLEMELWEHVTSMKCLFLRSEETLTGLKPYGVITTNICLGEEVTCKGRIIIFDIIEVVPEPGLPLTKNKIKVLYAKEQKGPVTAIAHINGLLVSAIGQKLYIWQFKNDDLQGVAFIDSQIYIHQLCTMKNLILAIDILKNLTVYRYQEEFKVLSLVSKDGRFGEAYTAEFMVDQNLLCFVVTDKMKNMILYSYHPEARESHGGQRLVRRGDFNDGSNINTMFRIQCKTGDPTMDRKLVAQAEKRHITFFATLDGSIGYLLPVNEKVYRRLLMLQNALITQIPHLAGLNPRAYRAVKNVQPELRNSQKNILDGELIVKFCHLSINEKTEITKRLGTSSDQIIDDLLEADRLTNHF